MKVFSVGAKPFGIHVRLIEPGANATEFGSAAPLMRAQAIDEYSPLRKSVFESSEHSGAGQSACNDGSLLTLVDAEDPALPLILGNKNLPMARAAYAGPVSHLGGVGGCFGCGSR